MNAGVRTRSPLPAALLPAGCAAEVWPSTTGEHSWRCARLASLRVRVKATGRKFGVCSTHFGVAALRDLALADHPKPDYPAILERLAA